MQNLRTIVTFASFVFAAAIATNRPAAALPHPGDKAPAFRLARATGGTVSLASYRGKPLYVTFFASWCGPCNEEAPSIRTLEARYRKAGLAVLGVDEAEPSAAALTFAKRYGWTFPIALDTSDTGNVYGAIVALPVHVFIDRHGIVRAYRFGPMQAADVEAAIHAIL